MFRLVKVVGLCTHSWFTVIYHEITADISVLPTLDVSEKQSDGQEIPFTCISTKSRLVLLSGVLAMLCGLASHVTGQK